ncbi:alpha-soluble NSF attachment protein-like [Corticium candelabrum]|uniref:alpha-soluble NSF attachment protein-like n=1 Tax=Corticium candelabrum TaxID=121492 RepID=UPI002E257355|nr:alpha-soluble NSF attachment protein-like [Corticium candelabrum]
MADSESKAAELMAQAERQVKSASGFIGRIFGGSAKLEEAADLYARAANSFKMAKKWSAAGNAFEQAASIAERLQTKHECAQKFVDAASCYKKSSFQDAIRCFNRAIEIFTDMGRFTIAAKHHVTIAEIYETDVVDVEQCIAHYEQAADFFKGENSNSAANKNLLKVAYYKAQLEDYEKAIEIYEQVAASSIEVPLLKYSAKDHFFRAALLQMCVDPLAGQRAVDKYVDMFPAFQDTRECKLLKKINESFEEQNVDAFTEAVKEYDAISRLDQWYTAILLKIKKSMGGEDESLR